MILGLGTRWLKAHQGHGGVVTTIPAVLTLAANDFDPIPLHMLY